MVSMNQLFVIGFVALFVLIGFVILAGGVGRLRAWWRLRGSEASAPGRLDTGPVEVEGTAKPLEDTLSSPRENVDSLVYEHVVKEKHVDHDPDQGTDTEWRTVVNDTETVPFVVEGEGGSAVVDPEGATKLLEPSVQKRQGDRRIEVSRLDVDEPVYVAGQSVDASKADVATDGQRRVVKEPTTWMPNVLRRLYEAPFVLSDAKEENAEDRLFWSGVKTLGLGVVWLGVTGLIAATVLSDMGLLSESAVPFGIGLVGWV
jgi:hypothetical protein